MYADDDLPGDVLREEWLEALEAQQEAMEGPIGRWWLDGRVAEQRAAASGPERAAERSEAVPGNTAIQSSNEVDCQWQVSGGVDYLEVTVWGWHRACYDESMELLEAARVSQHQTRDGGYVEVQGATLIVRERGHRWGSTFFPWVADYDGITFSFARKDQGKKCFQAKVQIGSLKLMRDGHRAAWAQAVRILEEVGIVVDRTNVARIDLCVDLPGVSVDPFCDAVYGKEVISRIKSQVAFYRKHTGEWSGCAVGTRASVHLRIYDKIEELKTRSVAERTAKEYVLIERRWGVMPEKATRVEFQIKGEWLKRKWKDCAQIGEVFDKLGGISEYLFRQYFRLVDGEVDRENKNQSKTVTLELWEKVTAMQLEWVGRVAIPLAKMEKKPVDRSRQVKRFFSSALAVAATHPNRGTSRQDFLQLMLETLVREMGADQDWLKKVEKKFDQLIADGSAGVFSYEEVDEFPSEWHVDVWLDCGEVLADRPAGEIPF